MKIFARFAMIAALSLPVTVLAQDQNNDSVYTEQKTFITVSPAHPEFTIKLESNPSTGFSYFLNEFNTDLIEPVKHQFVASQDKNLVGAPGYELWTFKMKPLAFAVPQQTSLRLSYARPWEKNNPALDVVFSVFTEGK